MRLTPSPRGVHEEYSSRFRTGEELTVENGAVNNELYRTKEPYYISADLVSKVMLRES